MFAAKEELNLKQVRDGACAKPLMKTLLLAAATLWTKWEQLHMT
jgi:hypothetical protein